MPSLDPEVTIRDQKKKKFIDILYKYRITVYL